MIINLTLKSKDQSAKDFVKVMFFSRDGKYIILERFNKCILFRCMIKEINIFRKFENFINYNFIFK